jgi:xylulokinase
MEGVAYSLKDCMEIIKGMDIEVKEVRASGGGGKSKLWRQIQADLFNTEVVTINSSEGPALGVALLAGVGAGVYSTVEEACNSVIKVISKQEANKSNTEVYEKYYKIYQNLYPALKEQFKAVAEII